MSERRASADVVVVGLGAHGSAITHHLARGGARVVGIDRFRPPHAHGSSHGETRITRLAIGEGHEYVPIVQRSHQLWRELEAETGSELLLTTGGLVIGTPAADALVFHGRDGFFERTVDAAQRFGIAHELLDAAEIERRFPAFVLAGDERGYYEPQAGLLRPEACVAAQLAAAARHGAQLRLDERVERVTATASGVRIETARGIVDAKHAVFAAGAWTPALLGGGVWERRLAVQRQVLQWFAADEPALYRPGVMPVFIRLHGGAGDGCYGFPMVDSHPGVKLAAEQTADTTTPEHIERSVADAENDAVYERHVRGRMRGIRNVVVHATTCLYTSTPDGRFVVDRHPELEQVTIVSACSGHGFKHSPALGEAVAARLLGRQPRFDLSVFAFAAQAWARPWPLHEVSLQPRTVEP
jgi:sarcosine oxidase